MNKQEVLKTLPELNGKSILLCEHQKKSSPAEWNLWIGENTRVILCPLCTSVVLENALKVLEVRVYETKKDLKILRFYKRVTESRFLRWVFRKEL